ncbi:MAG: hypothetical protein LBM93_01405 [Oscillospiraceae bacterium]|jgi:hypothetical protein|nr:hypothetical protein [Oscillospiraceae bacterium]
MKKLIGMLLTLTLFISFSSCSNKDDNTTVLKRVNTTNVNSKTTTTETEVQLEIEIVNNTVVYRDITHISIKNDGQTISDNKTIPVMNDVRSISCSEYPYNFTCFYIKNDNTLWAYGNNVYGQLGDGTGVDSQEDSKPVKILDNVANIYVFENGSRPTIYAVTNDKELYGWGENGGHDGNEFILGNSENIVYAPFKIMDDVVDVPAIGCVIKSDATLWTWDKENILANPYEGSSRQYDFFYGEIMPITKIADNVKKYAGNYTWIETDNTLVHGEIVRVDPDSYINNAEKVDFTLREKDVVEVFTGLHRYKLYEAPTFFLKNDGTLWGKGANTYGQLGDSTKVDRTEPVKIADNVKCCYDYAYLLNDGTYWTWNSNNPVPTQKYSGIYDIIGGDIFLSENGELFSYDYDGEKQIIFEDVKLS